MKALTFSISSIRALRRLPADVAARLLVNIEKYAADPVLLGDSVKKLGTAGGYRLRIADRSIIFDEDEAVVAILEVSSPGYVNLEGQNEHD
jgi:mRNA interferase RelE/StbE